MNNNKPGPSQEKAMLLNQVAMRVALREIEAAGLTECFGVEDSTLTEKGRDWLAVLQLFAERQDEQRKLAVRKFVEVVERGQSYRVVSGGKL
jgi:hypothetical protein